MAIVFLILLVLLAIMVLFLGFRLLKWSFRKKKRAVVFLSILVVVGLGGIVNHFFFKKMEFIQSKVYPNLYLVEHPDEDPIIVQKAIREKIREHLNAEHKTGKPLSYSKEKGIYFYEYGGMTFGFIGEAGTGYFIDHEEDLGGFVTEELAMYTEYLLAEFYYDLCAQDATMYCGELNYFEEGEFIKADSLKNRVSADVHSKNKN